MRIRTNNGQPINLSVRQDGGVTISQGRSWVMVSRAELAEFLDGICTVTGIMRD
ncbi:Uncharacterised protein [Mycobacteroides abscessus subsp. massiliense]|nr:Uncharacterised protein [Mycobacteroides abscessus subsp. massiliense]SKL00702.1 Uncharacterised protein [Mycobacteroides abscessus subsp. massiliense]SKM11184.1 Uncharacterised protein [Mycobacteroides abscessus subsp. massiliense]